MSEQLSPVVPITSTRPIFPNTVAHFQPRYIGPMGSRVSAVAGVVGNPLVYYVGAAAGGIFKTSDGGTTWQPVFDEQAAAIGDQPPTRFGGRGTRQAPATIWRGFQAAPELG